MNNLLNNGTKSTANPFFKDKKRKIKEKRKWIFSLVLSHVFHFIAWTTFLSNTPQDIPFEDVLKDHLRVTLPAQLYIPFENKRTFVTLKTKNGDLIRNAILLDIPPVKKEIGTILYTFEIHKKEIRLLTKNNKNLFEVLPNSPLIPSINKSNNEKKYEIYL